MSYFKTPWFETLPGVVFIAGAVIAILFLAVFSVKSAACEEIGEVSGRDTSFRLISGCYVEVKGRMIPADSWRGEQE